MHSPHGHEADQQSDDQPAVYPLAVERFQVVMGDTDAARVIYFGAPVHWAERISTTWMNSAGFSLRGMLESGTGLPAVHLEVSYKRPLRLDDLVEAKLWLDKRSERGLTFRTEFWRVDDDELACEVRLTEVFVVVEDGRLRPAPLPEFILAALDGPSSKPGP